MHWNKATALRLMKRVGLFWIMERLSQRKFCILCYHGIWRVDDGYAGDAMFMKAVTFERRLALLSRRGFSTISLDDAAAIVAGRADPPPRAIVITIDDGWYSTLADMLPALSRHRMKASIYCDTANLMAGIPVPHVMARYLRKLHVGNRRLPETCEALYLRAVDLQLDRSVRYAALLEFAECMHIYLSPYLAARAFEYMTPAELAEASAYGISIGLHTHNHTMHDFTAEAIGREIDDNRRALAKLLSRSACSIRHFCYPSGITAAKALPILHQLGITTATTLEARRASIKDNLLLLPRILDGEHLSEIEFESELCGVGDLLRTLRQCLLRLGAALPRHSRQCASAN